MGLKSGARCPKTKMHRQWFSQGLWKSIEPGAHVAKSVAANALKRLIPNGLKRDQNTLSGHMPLPKLTSFANFLTDEWRDVQARSRPDNRSATRTRLKGKVTGLLRERVAQE